MVYKISHWLLHPAAIYLIANFNSVKFPAKFFASPVSSSQDPMSISKPIENTGLEEPQNFSTFVRFFSQKLTLITVFLFV